MVRRHLSEALSRQVLDLQPCLGSLQSVNSVMAGRILPPVQIVPPPLRVQSRLPPSHLSPRHMQDFCARVQDM